MEATARLEQTLLIFFLNENILRIRCYMPNETNWHNKQFLVQFFFFRSKMPHISYNLLDTGHHYVLLL